MRRTAALPKSDWARGGLFQPPRLRVNDKLDPNPGGLSSTEQFFNVCFCVAFGIAKIDKYLVVSQDPTAFFAYFFAWWSAWIIGSEYASRYNNVDFTHKIFWTLYGQMAVGMLMYTSGGMWGPNACGFCISCAGIHAVVGLMTLRVALFVPEARYSGLWHSGFMILMAFFWVMAAILPQSRSLWWILAAATEPVSSTAFLLFFQEYLVPITKPYAVNKFAIICVLALGSFVAAAVGGVDPSVFTTQEKIWVHIACFFGFVLFMMFKFLSVDVDVVPVENHAISRSTEWRAAWRMLQPLLILTMVGASAGLAALLEVSPAALPISGDDADAKEREKFARRLAYWSTAAFFALYAFQRKYVHLAPEHISLHGVLSKQREMVSSVQFAVALSLFLAPFMLTSSGLPLHVRDIVVLAVTATGLVVLHLLSKQWELDILDQEDSLHEEMAASKNRESLKHAVLEGGRATPETRPLNESSTWEGATNVHAYDPEV